MILDSEEMAHLTRISAIWELASRLPESEGRAVVVSGLQLLVHELPQDVRDAALAGDVQPLVFGTRDPRGGGRMRG